MRSNVVKTGLWSALAFCVTTFAAGNVHAQIAGPVEVETSSFGEDSFSIGTLNQSTGALPRDLWRGSDAQSLSYLLDSLPTNITEPALTDALRRTLLSPGDAPQGTSHALTGKKLMVLARSGFYEEAASLAELAGGLNAEPVLSQAIAFRDMMSGNVDAACQRNAGLTAGRDLPFWVKLRVLCYVKNEEQSAAELTLSVMREKGLMTAQDEKLFNALVAGVKLKNKIVPENAFQYAAVRHLKIDLDIAELSKANGAVLRALATEVSAPQQARIYAAERALYFGIMSPQEVTALFNAFEFTDARKAEAKALLGKATDNYVVDALVFQTINEMSLADQAFDRSQLVGDVLRRATTLERFTALSQIYTPIAVNFEAIENYTPYAREFALAGIVTGNDGLTQKWLSALNGETATPAQRKNASDLLSLYALKSPSAAQSLSAFTGVEYTPLNAAALAKVGGSTGGDPARLAKVLNYGFEAARENQKGQSALVALAASGLDTDKSIETVRKVMMMNAFMAAGMEDVIRDLAFGPAVSAFMASNTASTAVPGNAGDADSIAIPRVKPSR